MTVYLDCNATTPLEPSVRDAVLHYMTEEFGNEGSRTHDFGVKARQAVQRARDQIAKVVQAERDEVIFTSGATEANNLAILGLLQHGQETNRRHIISTMIEHKAVLEPLAVAESRGFEVTLVPPTVDGWVEPERIQEALRPDTVLVSIMHVNNETGVIQPLPEISHILTDHPAFLHVDAAQGFGKQIDTLQDPRIDFISISGHKIYAPKGIGALITRRRGFTRPPLTPLFFGGGQERGLRPGTLPVPLIVGLGLASEIALRDWKQRSEKCQAYKKKILRALASLNPIFNCDLERTISHTINLSFPGLDSEALMVALKNEIAISNGSACTSHSYQPSHVLKAMKVPDEIIQGAVRISWCHLTEDIDWTRVIEIIQRFM
ncbi:MAG TPA: cysteine desulfurase DndA [Acidobacteriota bacterium]|nr:cysteine desulfurase DndA [Acidobacteriota bacterium]